MASFRVVSEIKYNGQYVDVPDNAIDVTVQPLAQPGAVRVTYLKRLKEVPVSGSQNEHQYVY